MRQLQRTDDTYYRIAVRCREDNEKLINAISEVIKNG
jgi:histidinol-phosphate/aromatic aminotransferase/cobyric acid decarboxylase-like protein